MTVDVYTFRGGNANAEAAIEPQNKDESCKQLEITQMNRGLLTSQN